MDNSNESITINVVDTLNTFDTNQIFIEYNISKLKNYLAYLETPHARETIAPIVRLELIKISTCQFKKFLQMKHRKLI